MDRNVETTSNNVGNKTQYSKMAVVKRRWQWPSDKTAVQAEIKEMETETETRNNHLKASYRPHLESVDGNHNDWRLTCDWTKENGNAQV